MLEQLAGGDHGVVLGVTDEEIILAVYFAGAHGPGGDGNRHGDAFFGSQQPP